VHAHADTGKHRERSGQAGERERPAQWTGLEALPAKLANTEVATGAQHSRARTLHADDALKLLRQVFVLLVRRRLQQP
jgi:hypothetical protein